MTASRSSSASLDNPEERVAFDMYFASLCSMQVHPGAGTKGHDKLSLEGCRDMAMNMLTIRRDVVGGL
jgi:hypothetical protein